jgi:hypothetical protein
VAGRLWDYIREQAPKLRVALDALEALAIMVGTNAMAQQTAMQIGGSVF